MLKCSNKLQNYKITMMIYYCIDESVWITCEQSNLEIVFINIHFFLIEFCYIDYASSCPVVSGI